MADRLDVTIRNDLAEIGRLAKHVDAFMAAHGLADKLAFELNLCLDELITNIVSYGYQDEREHGIRLQLTVDGSGLTVLLEDDARAFNPLEAAVPDTEASVEQRNVGGLGVHFVKSLVDRMDYRREAGLNRLTLWRRLDGGGRTAKQGEHDGDP